MRKSNIQSSLSAKVINRKGRITPNARLISHFLLYALSFP